MTTSFNVDDPDAQVTYPITDEEGGMVDWPDPTVYWSDGEILALWDGPAAPVRDLVVPVDTLPVGDHTLWLRIPGLNDLRLGTVYIVETDATTVPGYGDCSWPVDAACFTDQWEAMDETVKARALGFASATLYRLTGYRVGGCPITVRPCKAACAGSTPHWFPGLWMHPHITATGAWVNACGCKRFDCSCTTLCEVDLPGPVAEVQSITLDGEVVPPESYRVDGQRVVWTGDGDCPWPACQDMAADPSEPGTFTITYLNSYPVDGMGAYAAAVLAMEFAQACVGNNCRLPATVTSISRQGVSFDIPTGAFPNGFTGIREVDAYLGLWNPGALREQTRVWSPDLHPPRVVR